MGGKSKFNGRGKRHRLSRFVNGTASTTWFNGKPSKLNKNAKDYVPPVYRPKSRRHDVETPTSRYAHKPWPFKRKLASAS